VLAGITALGVNQRNHSWMTSFETRMTRVETQLAEINDLIIAGRDR
jgi:hypothetical protein